MVRHCLSRWTGFFLKILHYNVVIMSARASQITSVSIVCSTVGSGADHRKYQSSASLAFVRGIHQPPVNSPHKRPVTVKMFPFDDVVMISKMGTKPKVSESYCKISFKVWLFIMWILRTIISCNFRFRWNKSFYPKLSHNDIPIRLLYYFAAIHHDITPIYNQMSYSKSRRCKICVQSFSTSNIW